MRFLDGFFKELFLNEDVLPVNFRYTVCSKKCGYFENVLSIISYTDKEVVLKLKKGSLTVVGNNLFIKSYNKGDICIGGEILSVCFVG